MNDFHRDLKVKFLVNNILKYAEAHECRLHHHVNVEAIQLLDKIDVIRRLKRIKTVVLVE